MPGAAAGAAHCWCCRAYVVLILVRRVCAHSTVWGTYEQSMSHVLSVPDQSSSIAFPFLMLFGNTLCFWQLCRLAFASHQRLNLGESEPYYSQKIATTKFFATHILSRNSGLLTSILEGNESLEYADEQYFNQ